MRIGVDLGGTKIQAVVLDDVDAVCWQRRVPTPRDNYDGTVAAIARLVNDAETTVGESCTVGIGIPGAVSPATGAIKNANSTWLNRRPFKQDLEKALGREVRLANDANCLAVSEATDGAGAGAAVVFGVILGTGTGGGLVVHGELLVGANAIGGEWGHNPLPEPTDDERPGPACYCGRSGCIETFLSGPGLAADYAQRTRAHQPAPSRPHQPAPSGAHQPAPRPDADIVTGETVVARASQGEPEALATLEAWDDRVARSLASVINLVDPDVIVVGGGLSRLTRLYVNVPARWGRYVFSDRVVTRLLPATHGDASGVRGAAWLWGRD